jgi:rhamnulokinase
MTDALYIAVDLGAGSGRVFLAAFDEPGLLLEEIRRFHYPPTVVAGHLRWDLPKIFLEISEGIRIAGARARELGRRIQSIGVDSWGVDYGLFGADGKLVEWPICYRDERTRGMMEQVFALVPREEIFERTGIQFMPINTLFQLYAHAGEGIPAGAEKLLLIPDAINFYLTGKCMTEYTNATTTQMCDAQTRMWDRKLLGRLSLPTHLLPEVISPGAQVAPVQTDILDDLGIEAAVVVAPATHDTGSAIAGTPLKEGWAYISSGTWSLVGVERDEVLINAEVARYNFTNEGGVFGTIRFLKNVMGLWLLESCRREWQRLGAPVDYDSLLPDDAATRSPDVLIFPDDQRFLNPPSMLEAIATQLSENNQTMPDDPPGIAKLILVSLAFRYASVLQTVELLTGRNVKGVQIIGGGSQNAFLNQATANATRLPVCAGPVEATVIGNALMQAIAHGRFGSLSDARRYVAGNVPFRNFTPQGMDGLDGARRRYAEIEARYI